MGLNEAIDSFDPGRQREFYNHARQVMTHRLIDHFRREGRHLHISLDATTSEAAATLEAGPSIDVHRRRLEMQARQDEIQEYNHILQAFGLSLTDIKESAPKHRDTRDRLRLVAESFVQHAELIERLHRTRQLPLQELERLTGVSRKVLETGRRYIVAFTLLLIHEELTYLRSFAGIHPGRRGD